MDESILDRSNIKDDPWRDFLRYCRSEYSCDCVQAILSMPESEKSERFASGADIVENGDKKLLINRGNVNIYTTDHAYCLFDILSSNYCVGMYEVRRLFAEYDKRFIACHFINGEYLRIIGMTDRMEFTYVDQIMGEKGIFVKSAFDILAAEKAYNIEFKENAEFGDLYSSHSIPYYDKDEQIFVFYVDKDSDMLRLLTNGNIPDDDYGDFEIYNNRKYHSMSSFPECFGNIVFSAVISHPVVRKYFNSNGTDRPDDACVTVIRDVVNLFSFVVAVTLPDQSHDSCRTFVGYRFPHVCDVPMDQDSDNVMAMFSFISPAYMPPVNALGWDKFMFDDCRMRSILHYLACVYCDKATLESNIENGVYANYSDKAWSRLAHRSFIICETQLAAEKYVTDRVDEYLRKTSLAETWKNSAGEKCHIAGSGDSDDSSDVLSAFKDMVESDDVIEDAIKNNSAVAMSHKTLIARAMRFDSVAMMPEVADKLDERIDDDWRKFYKALLSIDYNDMRVFVKNRVKGHDDAIDKACYYVWSYLRSLVSKDPPKRDNFIIAGCSGCGKTEFMRAIRSYLDGVLPKESSVVLPIKKIDASSISMSGYKGLNLEELLYTNLYLPSAGTGIGIMFLDELDKKLLPQHDSSGENTNAAVQDNLLTAIEGSSETAVSGHRTDLATVDTRYTLFIGLGTFEYIRHQHEIAAKSSMGFTSELADSDDIYWDDITEEDVVEQGGKDEFLGRFSSLINFAPLSEDALFDIIISHIADKKTYVENITNACLVVDDIIARKFIKFARSRRGVRAMFHAFDDVLHRGVIDMLKQGRNNKSDGLKILRIDDIDHYVITDAADMMSADMVRSESNLDEIDDDLFAD